MSTPARNAISGLRFGPIGKRAVHAAIDMQRLFAEDTDWASPVVHAIAPRVGRIAAHAPHLTLFTRFLTPERAEDAQGQWQIYYRHWKSVLSSNVDADLLDLLPSLRRFTPPARDGKTHRIEVRLAVRNLEARTRKSYQAPASAAK